MRFSFRTPVLFVALLALLLALPVAANDETPAQASAAGTSASDCARVSPEVVPLLAPEMAPAWLTGARPAGEAISSEPIAQQGPPIRRGYCKCGCGITCETDADCGPGGSCVGFITCC